MRRQQAEAEQIDRDDRIPATHKAVAKLAAREKMYPSSAMDRYQAINGDLRRAVGDLADSRGLDGMPNPKGKGIGAFFGRLFNGRATEAQRRRQAETIAVFDGGHGFGLTDEEKAALNKYRRGVERDRPKGREASEVAAALGDHGRPRRYQAVSQAARQVEEANIRPADKDLEIVQIYQAGGNMIGEEGGRVADSQFIPGPASESPDGPAAPAAYRLGWASYAVFEKTPAGVFRGLASERIYVSGPQDVHGRRVRSAEVHSDTDGMKDREFGQISTAGVSACSVIIVKKGGRYAMLHLDAAHTEPGEAKDYLMERMADTFGGEPGEIEIMESVRGASQEEWEFCADLEDRLKAQGDTLKVQRVDRRVGRPEAEGYDDQPSGHLEIGLTSDDVVFGDRADPRQLGDRQYALQVRPFEWRLSAPQDAVNAIWTEDSGLYRQFTTVDDAGKYANDLAAERERQMSQAKDGILRRDPTPGRQAPGQQEAIDAAAVAQTESARAAGRNAAVRAEAREQLARQERAPQPQAARQAQAVQAQAQERQAQPRREHISQEQLRADVGQPERAARQRRHPAPEREAPQRERQAGGGGGR
jgi:hypothetical protein